MPETKNAIIQNAEDGFLDENEFTVEEYVEYLREMDPADFRKYYGQANIDKAEKVLLARKAELDFDPAKRVSDLGGIIK